MSPPVPASSPPASPAALRRVLHHYVHQIAGHFDPRVYRVAVAGGRRLFNWVSHVSGGGRVAPFGLSDLLPTRVTIEGESEAVQLLAREGTIVLLPTHQTHNDALLFAYVIDRLGLPPFRWGAGLNLFRNPLLASFLLRAGAFTVDRENPSAVYRVALRNYCARILQQGAHTLFFPGGGRSRSGAIESKLRRGLLAAGLQAQVEILQSDRSLSTVYFVPVTVSYHYVLEAPWLIDAYLAQLGIPGPRRSGGPTLRQALRGYWRFFGAEDGVTLRFGMPLDVFGEAVGDADAWRVSEARARELRKRLSLGAAVRAESERDSAIVRDLARTLEDHFYKNATVLHSQAVAYALFETLRQRHPGQPLARLLALPSEARSVPRSELLAAASYLQAQLRKAAQRGELHLSRALRSSSVSPWVEAGIARLRELHGSELVAWRGDLVGIGNVRLLYYYRNRLSGYGLGVGPMRERHPSRGALDSGGFLI